MCVNGCILYHKHYQDAICCPNCGENRYEEKRKPSFFFYLPLADTLRQRFSQEEWSKESLLQFPQQTDVIQDVTDSETWNKLKKWDHGDFAR